MSDTPIIALDRVTKTYGRSTALDHVGLLVTSGQFVALVGQSGSGKTTLLKTINGLTDFDSGSVKVDGVHVAQGGHALRRRIGYVFQQIGLFPHMTVAENITITQRLDGLDEAGRQARAAELLQLVSLPADFAERMPRELSGGQAQRVGLARALANAPSIVLMDEPFGALDPVTRDTLGQSYRALHEQLGLTTLMVTHDIGEALLLADRVVVLIDGRIVSDATPKQLMTDRDPAVAKMMAVPRRQAERLAALRRGR